MKTSLNLGADNSFLVENLLKSVDIASGDIWQIGVLDSIRTVMLAKFANNCAPRRLLWCSEFNGINDGNFEITSEPLSKFAQSLAGFSNVRTIIFDNCISQLSTLSCVILESDQDEKSLQFLLQNAWNALRAGGCLIIVGKACRDQEYHNSVVPFLNLRKTERDSIERNKTHNLLYCFKSGIQNRNCKMRRREVKWARFIVASYGEDLGWTREAPYATVIYTASRDARWCDVIPTKNQAREAGQYLHHIVSTYPHFYEWELFVQGNPFDHLPLYLEEIPDLLARSRGFVPLGRLIRFNPHFCEHDAWASQFAREWFGYLPENIDWIAGAQFAVSREKLLERPLEYWERLRDKVLAEEHRSPWAMERLWSVIFTSP